MKITNLKCLGKTDENGNLDDNGGHITFQLDMDDGLEYDLTITRNEACNLHYALGKHLTETEFKFKSNY